VYYKTVGTSACLYGCETLVMGRLQEFKKEVAWDILIRLEYYKNSITDASWKGKHCGPNRSKTNQTRPKQIWYQNKCLKRRENQFRKAFNIIKVTAFWDKAPCSLVEVDQLFHHRLEDGGSTHLCNVGLLQRKYMALYLRHTCCHGNLKYHV
jgi:hypothetical protein